MKKLIILTIAFVLFILFVIPFVAALLIKLIPDNDQPGYDINNRRAIFGVHTVSQVFTAQENNLMAIGISLGNPNLKNKSEVVFDLSDVGGEIRREVKISGANIQDGDFMKFNFEPIANSKGKVFEFTLASAGAGPEEVLNIYFSTQKTPWIGPATFDKEIVENGLPFVTYHKPASHLQVAKDIFVNWLGRIF